MKNTFTPFKKALKYFLLLNFFLGLTISTQAQIYVNQAATGNNDGTSWTNAYTELATALENYQAGDEIWVAAGTYLPQEPSQWRVDSVSRRTFYINKELRLYGGFAGTEILLGQRKPSTNLSILSGDLNGDDIQDDFDTNRSDNVSNVVYIEAGINATTIVDGFTISGGHAAKDDGFFPNRVGGGLISGSGSQVNNCIFQQNYALLGGGLYYYWVDAAGAKVENCIFQNNKARDSGGGAGAFSVTEQGISIDNCQFLHNEANQAGGLYLFQNNASVKNTLFSNNRSHFGGGMTILYNDEFGLNGQWKTNLYNCDFEGNQTELTGGGIEVVNSGSSNKEVSIIHCRFTNNISSDGGGFIYAASGASDSKLSLDACTFLDNQSRATALEETPNGGGLQIVYFGVPSQRDSVLMSDCLLENNASEGNVGGLFYVQEIGADNHLQLDNCRLIANVDNGGFFAGGLGVIEGGQSTSVLVQNSLFEGNLGSKVAAFFQYRAPRVPAPTQIKVDLINCIVSDNRTTSFQSSIVGTNSALSLTNCTLADNRSAILGTLGDGKITLHNNILQHKGFALYSQLALLTESNYINSLGGNLLSDNSLDAFLNHTDQSGTDPLFEPNSYVLSSSSPAIDAGVLMANPLAKDFIGNDRIQGGCIDIGAMESFYTTGMSCRVVTSSYESLDESSILRIYPNPVLHTARIQLENEWTGSIDIKIVNALGQDVWSTKVEKIGRVLDIPFETQDLPHGSYRMLLSNGSSVAVESFVKIARR